MKLLRQQIQNNPRINVYSNIDGDVRAHVYANVSNKVDSNIGDHVKVLNHEAIKLQD